jgi:hypothetical protein
VTGGVQLPLDVSGPLPLDPVQVAELQAPERGKLYRSLNLDSCQIEAIEAAVRLAIRREYVRTGR